MSSDPVSTVSKRDVITFLVVVFFFTIEALTHYSIGKTGRFTIVMPSVKDFMKIICVVVLVSLTSTIVSKIIDSYFEG